MPRMPRASDRKVQGESSVHSFRLVSSAYELAILACERKDAALSIQTVRLLRDVMESSGPNDVTDLLGMYDWCMDRIREGEYDLAGQMLIGLRDSWMESERRLQSPRK